ncbi:hypothetical protein ES707_16696 [subsurface metagenome]
MWHETLAKLRHFTDTVEFERMCTDLLKRSGFVDIVPRGPGVRDRGMDARSLHFPNKQVFQFSIQANWQEKLRSTFSKLARSEQKGLQRGGLLVFVTNRKVSPQKVDSIRDEVWRSYRYRVRVLDQEWLRAQLDLHQDIRHEYLGIPKGSNFETCGTDFSAESILSCFSVSDFIRQAFSLAVLRHKPWSGFVKAFCLKRLLPYIHGRESVAILSLFPKKPKGKKYREIIKIGSDEFTFDLYEPLEEFQTAPSEPEFLFPERINPEFRYSLRSVRGGLLVRRANDFILCVETAFLLLRYIELQFAHLSEETHPGSQPEYSIIVSRVARLKMAVSKLIAVDLACYLKTQGDLRDLCDVIELYYLDLIGYDWFIAQFLGALGQKFLRVSIKVSNNDEIERLLGVLHDYRVPRKFLVSAVQQAKSKGIEFYGV